MRPHVGFGFDNHSFHYDPTYRGAEITPQEFLGHQLCLPAKKALGEKA